ncbi:DNA topoisomerase IB [Pseudarthrobacter sp. J75]|uniref:DNA topoisomerase IB n=1 Tax=unclassified Pseudarthrobacter TaxID=2647000 RepID=UPI002E8182F0|nr:MULTISPECIES: DNA topoisomerase IB [unclassified Pseudarthrobacter]MEE2523942.1 DNA topoisomerase IB [Pseudarthrobacter sp. J47]MEE2528290.1 DNA topoisomerase IB [Pseudarthrobacter sp. J75]MEE2567992.1 DNA topoisomerase IB [Pseudarthrobacter sp. J64]
MRLRRSNTGGRGYRRLRAGKGFTYQDLDGTTVPPGPVRDRLDRLAIPPAWTEVWIAPFDNGHIQATGLDAVGRRQYIYHPQWRERKDRLKFDRALQLAESLPAARRMVTLDLRTDGVSRDRVLAAAFRMLDNGSLRVGSERYTNENGSRGLATLLNSHVRVRKDTVHLSFPAKSGKVWESEMHDADLAAVVRALKKRGGDSRLLAFKEGRRWRVVGSADINAYVKERTGSDFTAKDFRTLRGTVAAAVSLARIGPMTTVAGRKKAISQAMVDAAEVLGNTPSIARKSYVDPRLLDHYASGITIDPRRLDSAETELRALLFREGDVVSLNNQGNSGQKGSAAT